MSDAKKPQRRDRRDPGALPDDAQAIFDTVTGPNLRVKDNLIQLAVIVAGTILGAVAGLIYAVVSGNDRVALALVGGFIGVVASLLLSGAILGLVRAILLAKRR